MCHLRIIACLTVLQEKFCHDEPSPEPSPKKVAPKPKAKPATKKTKAATESARGVKRKAAAPTKKPKKRAKTESEESEAELSDPLAEISDIESEPPKKLVRRGKKVVAEESDEEEEEASKPSAAVEDESDAGTAPAKAQDPKGDISDSELSSVIDEEPVKKKKKAPATKVPKGKAPAKPKATPKAADDPGTAEVKRLQGWLVKCGIRKAWSRDPQLSACSTSKEKIRVLKDMLKDAGMAGKYSDERAAKIKEEREFAKDLEAIQEGEAAWGKTNEVTATGRPSRRAAAKPIPMQKVVLEDDSEEEGGGGEEGSDDDDDDEVVDGDSEDDDGDKSDGSVDNDSD